jgi:hypothetical protein
MSSPPTVPSFAKLIAEGIEPESDFPFGPYPKDKLIYKSEELVEYQTHRKPTDWELNQDS